MAEVFLSYSARDRDAAQSIAQSIEQSGLSVFHTTQMAAGASWQDEVRREVESAGCVLVLWSQAAAHSECIEQEIRLAIRAWSEDRLVLARLDDADLPAGLRDLGIKNVMHLGALVEHVRDIAAGMITGGG